MSSPSSTSAPTRLIEPYGGQLVDLMVPADALADVKAHASTLPSLQVSERIVCDLELLATGAFSPLDRFMGRADYQRVLDEMRLADGTLFPLPITLPVEPNADMEVGRDIALRNAKNELLAVMTVEEIYPWDKEECAQKAFGSTDLRHPLVAEMVRWGSLNISGKLQVLQLPTHYDYKDLRRPRTRRSRAAGGFGHRNVVAFQARNPCCVHEELTKRAAQSVDGVLLLHPVVGMTKPGDVDHFTRVRTYKALAENHYDPDRILLSLLPLAMRLAGPREAVWHAIIRRNYGANHLIVGRDHAGPGNDSTGKPFYGPYDAQELVAKHEAELGVKMIPFLQFVYLPEEDRYEEISRVPAGAKTADISGTQVRNDYLNAGRLLPEWFTRPEVAEILAESYPPRHKQGVCIWFTGLSGLSQVDHRRGADPASAGVRQDADRAGRRRGAHAPLEGAWASPRKTATPASAASAGSRRRSAARRHDHLRGHQPVQRHPQRSARWSAATTSSRSSWTPARGLRAARYKGMYAKARRGEIKGFTGIGDHEAPEHPEITLDTVNNTPEENARKIIDYLARALLRTNGS